MKKRVLSLLLCFVLAAGLLSVCAPPAQAGTIADAFELFIKQPGQIKKLFNREVAHGDCGPAGDEASVHYKIYEVTNPTVVQDNPFLQQIWQIHDYREDAQYYGLYIFGDGKMADYAATGQKAPWMGNVEVTEYNDKGQVLGTTVVENLGEEYLALAYIADGTDEEWDGRTERYSGVTNVGAYAFKDCRYLTCMFLNDDITTISERAFYKDEYLSAINMPRKLELIDKYAFYGCDTLTFVRARNCSRLRRIEDHAFYSCTMLAELRLPEGLTYIGPWAFAWDRILGQEDTTLGLPSSLQTISTGAFAFVNHHKNLNIPANVTSIGDFAFMCDYYMNNLTFSPGDKKLTIGKAAFFGDNHMKSVDLSNRVAQIDRCAFAGCEMLEEAYFGDKIDTIEGRAFTSLDNAMKIAVEGVLNGILRPDDTEQNADQAGDISTALNMIAKVTKLKRAVFKNDPAKSIYAAADSNRSFPDDCVVYYPQGSYTWLAELKDDGTWQGYKTGFWHGDHIAAFTDTVVAPTCTEQGYTLHTCKNCHDSYKDHQTKTLLHWYGEWTSNGDGTHSATCKRKDCKHVGKTECAIVEFKQAEATRTLCPVCGNVSDGTHLALVEEVTAEGEHLPYGELVLRMGETANGNTLLSVCFEVSGKLTRPKGEVKITMPAELLNGVTLALLNADGTEIDLPYIVEGENAVFTLDFTDAEIPTVLIRLIPTAE